MQAPALAPIGDLALSYVESGAGEPVVLVHAGVLADWFLPLLAEAALAERYRLIAYHRVNYGRSSHVPGPLTVEDHAEHCRLLLHHLGVERAHVVGHSAGAAIALQLAIDAPEAVHTLTVMDAALPDRPATAPASASPPPFVQAILDQHASGDADGAVDAFMRAVCGEGYRAIVDRALPGAFEQAVADADGLFHQEIPALLAWRFGPADAQQIACPVLAVAGGESPTVFALRQERLLDWLPNAEAITLPEAGHLLMLEQPRALAETLAAFLGRHPL